MKKMMILILAGVFGITVSLISGCNTVKGFGKDVSKGGQDIEKAASQ